jgi:pyrroloquinoline quinone biosynthesis protein B
MFAPFDSGLRDWRLIGEAAISIAGLTVRAIPVPGLPPSFAQAFEKRDLEQSPQAVAYEIAQSDGTTLLYAPIFGGVTTALLQAVGRSSAAFLDGSFWSDDELIAQSLGSRTARQMGHLPISGMGGSLELLRNRVPVRAFYTHVNNSNPVLESRSAERRALCDAGIAVAEDGMELDIQMGEHAARAEPSGV